MVTVHKANVAGNAGSCALPRPQTLSADFNYTLPSVEGCAERWMEGDEDRPKEGEDLGRENK